MRAASPAPLNTQQQQHDLHSSTSNLNATTAQLRNRETSYSPLPQQPNYHHDTTDHHHQPLYASPIKSPLAKTASPPRQSATDYYYPNGDATADVVDHRHRHSETTKSSSNKTSTYTTEKYEKYSSTSSLLLEPTPPQLHHSSSANVRLHSPSPAVGRQQHRDSASPVPGYYGTHAHRVASPLSHGVSRVRSPSPQLRVASPAPLNGGGATSSHTFRKQTTEESSYKRSSSNLAGPPREGGARSPAYYGAGRQNETPRAMPTPNYGEQSFTFELNILYCICRT